ncbi:MAG: DUF4199 domain-containing protein [Bacteroidota bacterium]
MKKNILIFGSISGLIVSSMAITMAIKCVNNEDFSGNMLLGYTFMLLAFSFVFVGIKNYRDKFNEGIITFNKAFKIGLLITLVASTIYVLIWLITYYCFVPDFMDKYTAHVLREAAANNPSKVVMDEKIAEMANYKEMYKNPVLVVLFTYLEIFPIGLLITIISALILKRKVNPKAS